MNIVSEKKIGDSERVVTTSTIVSKQFHKSASNVNRKIRNLKDDIPLPTFKQMFYYGGYVDDYGHTENTWYMNRDGFFMIVKGFRGTMANQLMVDFIHQFDAMERELTNPLAGMSRMPRYMLAQKVADSMKRQYVAEKRTEAMLPDYNYGRTIQAAAGDISVSDLAHLLDKRGIYVGRNKLFQWLRGDGILASKHSERNLPYQRYINGGYFHVIQVKLRGGFAVNKTVVTPKGQKYLINRYQAEHEKYVSLDEVPGVKAALKKEGFLHD